MWDNIEQKLALLELLTAGTLKLRAVQRAAFDHLAHLPWTRQTGRRHEIELRTNRRQELEDLLTRVWPDWPDASASLAALDLPPTPEGWEHLLDSRRSADLPVLPARVNRHTAASLIAPHSKSSLTGNRQTALGETTATHDGIVRLRPPSGLLAQTESGTLNLSAIAEVLGEVAIPERAFLDGLSFTGSLAAVLLVENLGVWRDISAPSGWLIAHVPGWDTATVSLLLGCLTHVPVIHFGDLDPNGVRIYQHLRERRPDLLWFVPDFWADLIETHAMRKQWPDTLDLSEAPPCLRELSNRSLWLEQELVALDPRIPESLTALLCSARESGSPTLGCPDPTKTPGTHTGGQLKYPH